MTDTPGGGSPLTARDELAADLCDITGDMLTNQLHFRIVDFIQARERAAAEKMRRACVVEIAKALLADSNGVAVFGSRIRAIDVDAVLRDSPPPATPGGHAPHLERGT